MDSSLCEAGACIEVDAIGTNVRIRSTISFTTCQATADEWAAFIARVKAGAFDHIGAEVGAQV
jgi:hypothetical protein